MAERERERRSGETEEDIAKAHDRHLGRQEVRQMRDEAAAKSKEAWQNLREKKYEDPKRRSGGLEI